MLEAEDSSSRPRAKFWPRGQAGQLVVEDFTLLRRTINTGHISSQHGEL